jgi:hypothetical protein
MQGKIANGVGIYLQIQLRLQTNRQIATLERRVRGKFDAVFG